MFKIIQLTDTHLLADRKLLLRGCSPYARLEQVLRHVRRHHPDAGLLLLTGDLSEDGSAESYRWLQELIGSLNVPAAALPGNHDDASLMRTVLDRNVIALPRDLERDNWQILLLDSTVPGKTEGLLSGSELEWLRRRLAEKTTFALIAVHHPPVPVGSPWMDRIGLKNAGELLAILAGARHAKAVVFGHVHQVAFAVYDGLACYGTPSTWRQFKPNTVEYAVDILPPAYRVLNLFSDGNLTTHVELVSG
jgi:Icc protein